MSSGRRRVVPQLGAFALYAGLAILTTWPLVLELRSAVPLGTEPAPTVPLFSTWTLCWNADRAAHAWAGYWNAPILAPSVDTFALSEAMPLPGALLAPLVWLAGPGLAHGVWALLALTLNGVAGRSLARRLGVSPPVAVAAGAALTLLPFAHQQLGVLTLAGVFGVVWTLDSIVALDRALDERADRREVLARSAVLGGALAVTYLCCAQYAAFAAMSAAPAALVLWATRRRERARWIAAAVAAAVAVAAAAPVVIAQRRAAGEHPMQRLPAQIAIGGASLRTWALASGIQVLPQPVPAASPPAERALFPGLLKLALAIGAVWLAASRAPAGPPAPRPPSTGAPTGVVRGPMRRRSIGFLAATAAVAFCWTILPRTGALPALLMSILPGIGQIRSVWRIGMITQVVVVVLAFVALERLLARAGTPRARVAAWALIVLAAVELWPRTPRLEPLPDAAAWQPVLAWIDAHVPPDGIIAHLPMPASTNVRDFASTTRWMLLGCEHGRRLINGYSGSLPFAHYPLWKLLREFPSPAGDTALARLGVRTLVVEDTWLEEGDRRSRLAASGWSTALSAPGPRVTVLAR